jgi:hypothetical protein
VATVGKKEPKIIDLTGPTLEEERKGARVKEMAAIEENADSEEGKGDEEPVDESEGSASD